MPPGAFRLLLAGAVVVSHISNLDIGRVAVILFFFLSGYWTAGLWRTKFSGAPWRFYLSRYLRIAPLYLLATTVALLVLDRAFAPETFTILGIASSDFDPLGISWALDVELQYYLLVPILLPLLVAPRFALAASFVAAVVGWLIAFSTGIVTVLQYLPAFVLGALAMMQDWRPTSRQADMSAMMFVGATVAALLSSFGYKDAPDIFHRDIFAFLWALPLLPYVTRSLVARSGPRDRIVGNVSYPLYLLHYPVIVFATTQFGGSVVVRLLAAGAALALAVAVYWTLDRPLDRWRVQLTERTA